MNPMNINNISNVYYNLPYYYYILSDINLAFLNEYMNYEIPIWKNVIKNAIHHSERIKCSPITYNSTASFPV